MSTPTVVQIVHAEAGGGVETLARMIEAELNRRGFAIETRVLYSRPDLPAAKKLAIVDRVLGDLAASFDVMTMRDHAAALQDARPMMRRAPAFEADAAALAA